MRLNRPPYARLFKAGLVFGLTLGAAGCSDSSRQGGSVPVLEADQQVLQKSAKAHKEKMLEKAKLPRSKQNAFD